MGFSQVTDLSFLFYGCSSLGKLPDLSNWDTSNVKNMKQMFEGCSILKQLPEIDKWIVKEVKNMSHMFYGCFSLLDCQIFQNGIYQKLQICL